MDSTKGDFKSVLIEDSRVAGIGPDIHFGVMSSGKSTYQQYAAISASNTNLNFTIQVPNQSVVIDRNVLFQCDALYFTLTATNVPPGKVAMNFGVSEAMAPFMINQLITTITALINNVSVSANVQDILAILLRMNDNRVLSAYNSTTASLPDTTYANYFDSIDTTNCPLNGVASGDYDNDFQGRGTINMSYQVIQSDAAGVFVDNSLISTDATNVFTIAITIKNIAEPFIGLSPFLNCDHYEAGLLGISQMSFNINIDNSLKRFMRTANAANGANNSAPTYITSIIPGIIAKAGGTGITGQNNGIMFGGPKLLFNYINLQPSQVARMKSSKNCLSYMEFPRYITPSTGTTLIAAGGTSTFTSSALQLNMVPDLIYIGIRVPMSQQNISNSDSWLTITNISVSFNATSGLLASATPQDLFRISKRNGSSQSWFEFSGLTNKTSINVGTGAAVPQIGTTGSLLVINPAYDLNLDEYLSSSSSGAFNLYFTVQCFNQYGFAFQPEIITVCQNSGIFTTVDGVSSSELGILTKQTVLDTKMNERPESVLESSEYQRLVGGKMHNKSMFNSHPLKYHHKHAKHHSGKAHAHGGVLSGGAISGGMHHSKLHKYLKH